MSKKVRSLAPRAASRPRVGLAFGGGLPFGTAAIGVIDVFERHGLSIDCLAGTSMGSIIGLLYAYGYSPPELEDLFTRFFQRRRLIPALLRDLRPTRSGFVNGNSILRVLSDLLPEDTTFENLQIPFAVPAADLLTGQEVVFRSGPVFPAIRASIALPGIFTPFEYQDTFLVDGAVITPIPVHLLDLLGADLKIPMRAVRQRPDDVRQRIADMRQTAPPTANHAAPDLLRLLWRSLSLIMQDQYAELLLGQFDVYLKPEIPFDLAGNPEKVAEIIAIGRREAEAQMPALRAALAAQTRSERPPEQRVS
jgi:NTE family protein